MRRSACTTCSHTGCLVNNHGPMQDQGFAALQASEHPLFKLTLLFHGQGSKGLQRENSADNSEPCFDLLQTSNLFLLSLQATGCMVSMQGGAVIDTTELECLGEDERPHVSPSAQIEKLRPASFGAAGPASQSQNSLASLGGTPSPCTPPCPS